MTRGESLMGVTGEMSLGALYLGGGVIVAVGTC